MQKSTKQVTNPSLEALKTELKREKNKKRCRREFLKTVSILIVAASVAILIATIWLPILQIYGSSMSPTLEDGDIVVTIKGSDFEEGDLISFYVGNKLLVKRYIAGAGQWVDIDPEGNVYVDEKKLEEPYLSEKAFGDTNIQLPYQVPDNRFFVIGDHRETSVDSRNEAIGCISDEQIVGKIVFRIWPLKKVGVID